MWFDTNTVYQIYTLGFCGAPYENDGVLSHRILKVKEWIPYFKKLGIGTVLFNPVFESDRHGYDTRDYRKLDVRLGTNEDFKDVCHALHEAGIRIVLDGVFNHVGRGFFGFRDVQEKKWDSPFSSWFNISYDGNDAYNDGFWYEGWEGCYDLVKLNLNNEEVVNYHLDNVKYWVEEFGIDGLRLDVAYCLDRNFIRRLKVCTNCLKNDFILLGEMIGGNYNDICGNGMCDYVTNYDCYKGLYSAFNSMNMFEIIHSINRQQGMYRGFGMYNFADNHDVTRVYSILSRKEHLPLLYTMLFTMPGTPSIYYGSEWGQEGEKKNGDQSLRTCFGQPKMSDLTDFLVRLISIRKESQALCLGSFRSLLLTNRQCVFERKSADETLLILIIADENDFRAYIDAGGAACGTDLISGREISFRDGAELPACSSMIVRIVQ